MQRGLVDGFVRSLNENNAYDLHMNRIQHSDLKQYFTTLQGRLQQIPKDISMLSSQKTFTKGEDKNTVLTIELSLKET